MIKPKKISAYAINLVKRPDRKASVLREFVNKREFRLAIVPAVVHEVGSYGLWQTICRIVKHANDVSLDYVLICEDDHQFTESYSAAVLNRAIASAAHLNADVLCGGVSWFNQVLQIEKCLFWVDRFNATQFMVIFRKFYDKMIAAEFNEGDDADLKISSLTDDILLVYPYISIQKEFGYSDVTLKNAKEGYVTGLFENREQKLKQLEAVASYYGINDDAL